MFDQQMNDGAEQSIELKAAEDPSAEPAPVQASEEMSSPLNEETSEETSFPLSAESEAPTVEAEVEGGEETVAPPPLSFPTGESADSEPTAAATDSEPTAAATDSKPTVAATVIAESGDAPDPNQPLPGAEWGETDADGEIRLTGGSRAGRVVGKAGDDPAVTYAWLVKTFAEHEAHVLRLAEEVARKNTKSIVLQQVQQLLESLPEAHMLGDIDALLDQLRALESEIVSRQKENAAAREALCLQSETLADSEEWRATANRYRALLQEWKAIGPADRETDESLWGRFKDAQDRFYERRKEYFDKRNVEMDENRIKKTAWADRAEELATSTDWRVASEAFKELTASWKQTGPAGRDHEEAMWTRFQAAQQTFFEARRAYFESREHDQSSHRERKEAFCAEAEGLRDSTDWKATGDRFKTLMDQWRQTGSAGRTHEDQLWNRFQAARTTFFDRRSEHFESRDREESERLQQKLTLCEAAENLFHQGDPFTAIQQIRALQEEWKTIGHIPRDQVEATWERFRAACDRIFQRADGEREKRRDTRPPRPAQEPRYRRDEGLERKLEQLDRLRDSIRQDEESIARWQDATAAMRAGGKGEALRISLDSHMAEVGEQLREKQERLKVMRAEIQEYEETLKQSSGSSGQSEHAGQRERSGRSDRASSRSR